MVCSYFVCLYSRMNPQEGSSNNLKETWKWIGRFKIVSRYLLYSLNYFKFNHTFVQCKKTFENVIHQTVSPLKSSQNSKSPLAKTSICCVWLPAMGLIAACSTVDCHVYSSDGVYLWAGAGIEVSAAPVSAGNASKQD